MSDRIEKSWEDLDWNAVNFKSSRESDKPGAGHWCWGCGGFPLGDHEFSISYVDDDLVETCYKMPAPINEMLRLQEVHATEAAKREIESAFRKVVGCHNECPLKED